MMNQLKISLGILIFLFPYLLFAQGPATADIPKSSTGSPADSQSPAILYAHFDKNIYSINETVWFTAYLTNDQQQANLTDFILALLVDDHRHIILEQKFLMNKGIASGNILLPDSLLSGRYKFILYTNTLHKGLPQNIFTQPIVIKGAASVTGVTGPAPGISPKPGDAGDLRNSMHFYPEGGSLAVGLNSKVALQVKTGSGAPQETRALLFEDGRIVDTIITDRTGTGLFAINPKAQSSYLAEIVSPSGMKGTGSYCRWP